jgi:hypothetical protein
MNYKRVEIVWYDIYEVDGWRSAKSLKKHIDKEPKGIVCRTIGYIVLQSAELISLAQTVQERGASDGEMTNFINIPTGIIKEMRDL